MAIAKTVGDHLKCHEPRLETVVSNDVTLDPPLTKRTMSDCCGPVHVRQIRVRDLKDSCLGVIVQLVHKYLGTVFDRCFHLMRLK